MMVIAFFFFLTLELQGYGQPTEASQALRLWGKSSETRKPLVERVKRNSNDLDDDDYEPYETPTPELMGVKSNLTTLPLVTTESMQQEVTSAPVTMDLVKSEPTTAETIKGKLSTEELTTEAAEWHTTNAHLAEEPTSALPSKGQHTIHDLSTAKVATDAPETVVPTTEEPTSKVSSPGQQDIHNHTSGDVGTETAGMSTMGPSVTSHMALDTDKPNNVTTSMGQLVTDSATTKEPPTSSLPAEPQSNHGSPASRNASAFFFITVHPIHNFSTTFSPPIPTDAHSDPPKPEVATKQVGPSNSTALVVVATTAHMFMSGHIPVRQCLLAVLILALVATIFLICTVILAIRLSKKGHTYPVRDYSPTEMVCISSLLTSEEPSTANGGPTSAKTQLLKPSPGPGEDCDGDDLTLHSFLP